MPVHIGKTLKRLLEKQGVSPAELGKQIGRGRSSVYAMFRQKYLHSALMVQISEALGHDIIRYLYLPNNLPANKALKQRAEELKRENETLRQENRYLKEINTMLKNK